MQGRSGWLLGLLLCAAAPTAEAAATPMAFRHLTVEDGLAQNSVMATLQDANGFVWLATENGLDRYDGYALRHFAHRSGVANSLSGNWIWAIKEDRAHNLWLAIKDGGVAKFDPRTETVTNFRHDPDQPDSLSSDAARQLLVDRSGRIWVATAGGGLNILDPVAGRFRRLRHHDRVNQSLSSDTVFALAEDQDGRIWVGTDAGLDLWQPESDGFRHFSHSGGDPHSLASNSVSTLDVDSTGTLWIGTFDAGLSRFNPRSLDFDNYPAAPDEPGRLSNPEIRAITEDSEGRLWLATALGLNLLDRATGRFSRWKHEATDPSSLRDDYVMSLYQDREGMLWVGTRGGGVSRWNPRSWHFGHVVPSWLADAYAISFADDDRGRLWVGTMGAGLYRFDPATGQTTKADTLLGAGRALPDSRVMALLRTTGGDLWVGTMRAGLLRFSPNGRRSHFGAPGTTAADPRFLGANGIMSLHESADGRVWVGTFGGGIAIIDPQSERVERIEIDARHSGGEVNPPATSIAQGPDGTVWVGTDGAGILALRPDGSMIGGWHHDESAASSIASNTVYAVHVDTRGRVWIGTDNAGLDLVQGSAGKPQSLDFHHVASVNHLVRGPVYGIEGDDDGGLWLSGTRGLVHYRADSGELRVFHREDGLQGEEFNSSSHFKAANGALIFGGSNGFNLFDPRRILKSSPAAPRIALTAISLKGRQARSAAPALLQSPLDVSYRDDVATFEFAALDYDAPDKTLYSYRLLGFDDRWSNPSTVHQATYTNLDAGNYVLEVRAAAGGSWSRQPLRLPLTVRPPPWKSRVAYALYGLGAVLAGYGGIGIQRRKLRLAEQQSQRLEHEVAARTEELRSSNCELERLTRAKSDFLARMSHEIRTPMNGIIGMGELLLRTELSQQQRRIALTVDQSARSLMQILNDTLDLAKVEAGRLTLSPEPFDLAALLCDTIEVFATQAHDQGIELIAVPPPDIDRLLLGDPLRIRQILLNIVGNAVKFTKTGEVVLTAQILERSALEALVALCVRDTGPGMEPQVIARIFEPFTQGDESTTRRFGGTGLGLTICRELTALMGGRIEAASEPGRGSTFTVTLRLPLAAPRPADLPEGTRPAVVVSRRARLADAVQGLCAQLGAACRRANPDEFGRSASALAAAGSEIVIIDVDSCKDEAEAVVRLCIDARYAERCVFLGSPQALTELDTANRAPAARSALKPLNAITLRELLGGRSTPPVATADGTAAAFGGRLRGTVLIVEDNAVNAAVFEGLLDELGCTHKTVPDGRTAVAVAAAESFDAILMDVHMPHMDGWQATELIRRAEADARHTPIIALTADAAEGHRRRCREAGMDDFLAKPLSLDQLRAALGRWLETVEREPAAEPAGDVLSQETLSRIRGMERNGRGNLLGRVISIFVESSRQQINAILSATAERDLATVMAQCHSLKSAAAHVGAAGLADLAIGLERAAADGNLPQVTRLADGLRAARAAAVDALQGELTKGAA